MVDLEWFRSFVAVYRSGTVSAAARVRFLTQPAVSQHILALEAKAGHPLFLRTPRRMVPTEPGKALYSEVAQAVDRLGQALRGTKLQEPSEDRVFRIGSPVEYFVERVMDRLFGLQFRYWVGFGHARDLLEKLDRGDLDMVIATQRLSTSGIEYSKLADERFILVGPPGKSPRGGPGRGNLSQAEKWLAAQEWISYGTELPIIRRFWQECFGRRPDIRPVLVIPNLHAILRAVELGIGISLLPDYLCRAALKAKSARVLWEPPQRVVNEIWLAFRKTDRHDAEARRLRDRLTSTPEQTPPARSSFSSGDA